MNDLDGVCKCVRGRTFQERTPHKYPLPDKRSRRSFPFHQGTLVLVISLQIYHPFDSAARRSLCSGCTLIHAVLSDDSFRDEAPGAPAPFHSGEMEVATHGFPWDLHRLLFRQSRGKIEELHGGCRCNPGIFKAGKKRKRWILIISLRRAGPRALLSGNRSGSNSSLPRHR
jgi:hypothetical protein